MNKLILILTILGEQGTERLLQTSNGQPDQMRSLQSWVESKWNRNNAGKRSSNYFGLFKLELKFETQL